jgi:hypothetical protein
MPKRFYLNEWKVPPPNPSPDEQRAIQLRRLREQMPPAVPPVPVSVRTQQSGADATIAPPGATRRIEKPSRNGRDEGKIGRILHASAHYPPEEDSDLSLYDDLGIPRTATLEEIRQAHRALVRLLHPDRIQDEYTRRIAETTLKKINAAFAVLSDAAHREAYDRQLGQAGGSPLPQAPRASWLWKRANLPWLYRNLLWIGGTLAGLAVIFWVLGSEEQAPRTVSHTAATSPVAAAAPSTKDPQPLVRAARVAEPKPVKAAAHPRQGEMRREPPRKPIEPPRTQAKHPALIAPPEIARAEPDLLPPPPELPTAAPPIPPPASKPTLDGLWVYLKPAQSSKRGNSLYPPEFIELQLREVNGVLRGRYSARYQVADRPISPEVRFQFEGDAASATPATFNWTGNGGSRGEVRLHKVGDQQLQVLWFTTQPGPEIGLSSGSATLIRRQAP